MIRLTKEQTEVYNAMAEIYRSNQLIFDDCQYQYDGRVPLSQLFTKLYAKGAGDDGILARYTDIHYRYKRIDAILGELIKGKVITKDGLLYRFVENPFPLWEH